MLVKQKEWIKGEGVRRLPYGTLVMDEYGDLWIFTEKTTLVDISNGIVLDPEDYEKCLFKNVDANYEVSLVRSE